MSETPNRRFFSGGGRVAMVLPAPLATAAAARTPSTPTKAPNPNTYRFGGRGGAGVQEFKAGSVFAPFKGSSQKLLQDLRKCSKPRSSAVDRDAGGSGSTGYRLARMDGVNVTSGMEQAQVPWEVDGDGDVIMVDAWTLN